MKRTFRILERKQGQFIVQERGLFGLWFTAIFDDNWAGHGPRQFQSYSAAKAALSVYANGRKFTPSVWSTHIY